MKEIKGMLKIEMTNKDGTLQIRQESIGNTDNIPWYTVVMGIDGEIMPVAFFYMPDYAIGFADYLTEMGVKAWVTDKDGKEVKNE